MKAPTKFHKYDPTGTSKKYYYVSCIDAGRVGIVAGPFPSYQEAEQNRRRVSDKAEELNPRSFWYAWGICGSDERLASVFGKNGITY